MFASKEWVKDLLTKVLKTKKDSLTPTGTIISFMGNIAPTGYFICDGAEYNIVDYPEFVNYLQEQFGSINYFGGDGTTTFAVPDLRGEFLRGTGNNGGKIGEHQDATQHVPIYYDINNKDFYLQSISTDNDGYIYPKNVDSIINKESTGKLPYVITSGETNTEETCAYYTSRPTNTSVLYCIKY